MFTQIHTLAVSAFLVFTLGSGWASAEPASKNQSVAVGARVEVSELYEHTHRASAEFAQNENTKIENETASRPQDISRIELEPGIYHLETKHLNDLRGEQDLVLVVGAGAGDVKVYEIRSISPIVVAREVEAVPANVERRLQVNTKQAQQPTYRF
ncbi:hypothetical protein OU5_P0315 (plasmid) [Pseudomonas mandelii JR-1]|uniref:Pilus formation protein N-terminal domain-containing protein n=2 Tax=Pseudomonas TaxID=286 RepID=A0ABR6TE47_9PSED|nr:MULTISPECIES: hypothetical protein [Pseudomonas]AHZ73567.1 hypothetical protein OU5_P0315 [Pseudomonas mandelii JR-1]MBC2383773.1 hypothetical protein [Pseudomonas cremoris]MDY7069618.1 hypothetical protein [Pseudomonas extremaustralis]